MSLHIYLIHNYENRRGLNQYSLNFLFGFLSAFNNEIKPLQIKFIDELEEDIILSNEKVKKLNDVKDYLKRLRKKNLSSVNVKIDLNLFNMMGVIILHNSFNSKIYGDIELDIYSNDKFESMAELIKEKKAFGYKLDNYFSNLIKKRALFRRVYIDEKEEGEEDPLDKVYEYDIEKHKFVKNMIKIVETHDKFEELDEKMKGFDRELISSWVWNNFQDIIIRKAKNNNVVIASGSFRQFSDSRETLKSLYFDCIDEIFVDIFNVKPIEERIKEKAMEMQKKL